MARKTQASNEVQVVRLDNQKRELIKNKYLTGDSCTALQRESAIDELCLRNDYEVLEEYVYHELLVIGSPSGSVIRNLKKNYGLTQLAATYIVEELSKHTTGSLNLSNEYAKTLINVDNNIANLNRIIEGVVGSSVVDTDIDVNGLFQEQRNWLHLKSQMINNGINAQILKVNAVTQATKNEVSLEELQKQLAELDG